MSDQLVSLNPANDEVVATFRHRPESYADAMRRRRVELTLQHCRGVFECSFGDPQFIELARQEPWDLLCHHAADVTNYRSASFDVPGAVANNTRNIDAVLAALQSRLDIPLRVVRGGLRDGALVEIAARRAAA